MKMYALYHDIENLILKLESSKLWQERWIVETYNKQNSVIATYNSCYYLSTNKKALLAFAEELKQQWIEETKERLVAIENMEIEGAHR